MKTSTAFQLLLLVGLSTWLSGCNRYDPLHPDTAKLKGVWASDDDASHGKSVRARLAVYATHMEYNSGQGIVGTQGEWRDNGFWCRTNEGAGEIEAVKVAAPDEILLQLAAFKRGNRETVTLRKEEGSDEERKALAVKYPPPILYPPPQGVIREGMTEYELRSLPWKPYSTFRVDPVSGDGTGAEAPSDDGVIDCYRSDNPNLVELRVMVQNHKVMSVSGGNG